MNNVNKNFNSKEYNDKVINENNLNNNIDEYNSNNTKNSINIIDSNDIKENEKSFFIMTLECENGKFDQIKIYPDSEPEELAFNFCIQNDLDCSTMKYITQEIKELLIQFKKNNDLKELSKHFFKQQKEIDKNFENDFDFSYNKNKFDNSKNNYNNEKNDFKKENGENLSFKIENDNSIDNKLIEKNNKFKENKKNEINENDSIKNEEKINDKKSQHSKYYNYENNMLKEKSIENEKSEHTIKSHFDKKSLDEKSNKEENSFNEIQFIEKKDSNEEDFFSQNISSELSSSFLSKDTGKKINVNNTIKTNKNENIINQSTRNFEENNSFEKISVNYDSIKSERRIKKNIITDNRKLNENNIINNIHKNRIENDFTKIIPQKKYSFQKMNFKLNEDDILNKRTYTPINNSNIIDLKKNRTEDSKKLQSINHENSKTEFHLQKNINNIDDFNILEHQIESNYSTNNQNKKIISLFRKDTNEIKQNENNIFQRIKTFSKSNLVNNKILKKDSPKKIRFANLDDDKIKINNTIMPMVNFASDEEKQKNHFTIHNIENDKNEEINEKDKKKQIKENKKEETLISNKKLNLNIKKKKKNIENENKKKNNEIKKNNTLLSTKNQNYISLSSDIFTNNNKPLNEKSTFIENKHYIPINYKEGINYKLIDLYNEDEKSYNSFYSTKTPKIHKKNIKQSSSTQKDLLYKRNISPDTSLSKNLKNIKKSNSNTTLLDKNNISKRSKSSARISNKINYGEYLYKKGLIDKKMKNEKIRKLKLKEERRIIANCSFSPKINLYHPFKNKSFSNLKLHKNINNNTTTKVNKQNENKINESTRINKINPYNNNSKNIKKKKLKKITLTKSDLQKIYLKKNLKIIKTELEQNYTFKPKINNNYNCSPGIIFFQREEIYQQYKKRKDMLKPQTTRTNKNNNISRNKFRPNSTRNNFRDNSNSKNRNKNYSFNSFLSEFSK